MPPKFSQHKLTGYRVQAMHHRALYLDHLPFAITEKYKDTDGLTALERELFIDTSLAWELGEIEMVGYVGLYHLWERYSKDFVSTVLGKRQREWPKILRGRSSYTHIVCAHLKEMDLPPADETLKVLHEANAVVNAYKHGDHVIERLSEKHPEYFVDAGSPESFHIPEGKLKRFFDAVDRFWEDIKARVDLDFSSP